MEKRSMKRKLLRARIALKQTIDRILDINRRRKHLTSLTDRYEYEAQLDEELKVLNSLATHQAKLVDKYETELAFQKA